MRFLKQSTAVTVPIGPFYDATDGVTLETALTIPPSSIFLSRDNGALATKDNATTATYDAAGIYRISLGSTVDVSAAGNLRIVANVSGAVGVFEDFVVLPGQVYDSLVSGTDLLDVAVPTTVTIDAAGVRAAVGLASANLDTQIDAIPTVAENQSGLATTVQLGDGTVVPGSFTANAQGIIRSGIGLSAANLDTQLGTIDTVADGIKAKTDQLVFTVANRVDATATLGGTDVTKLDELHSIHGLTAGSPLTVSETSRAAAAITQTIASAGGTTTVTRT